MDPSKFSICSDTHACEQTNITVSKNGIKCDICRNALYICWKLEIDLNVRHRLFATIFRAIVFVFQLYGKFSNKTYRFFFAILNHRTPHQRQGKKIEFQNGDRQVFFFSLSICILHSVFGRRMFLLYNP